MYFSDSDVRNFILGLIVFGIIIGLAIAFSLPWLWQVLKPWLHWISA